MVQSDVPQKGNGPLPRHDHTTKATALKRHPASEPLHGLAIHLVPRGLSRVQAAAYIGVSPSKFDKLVLSRRMPKAKIVDARRVWDRFALDMAFAMLPEEEVSLANNPWDQVER